MACRGNHPGSPLRREYPHGGANRLSFVENKRRAWLTRGHTRLPRSRKGYFPATAEPPAPTPVPPTPTPVPPRATPATQPQLEAGWMSGRWQITDTVTQGPDTGASFAFVVTLNEAGGRVSGSGDGLSLDGARQGTLIRVDFFRTGAAAGVFEWQVQPDGTLVGTFEDFGGNNGGVSVARRLF